MNLNSGPNESPESEVQLRFICGRTKTTGSYLAFKGPICKKVGFGVLFPTRSLTCDLKASLLDTLGNMDVLYVSFQTDDHWWGFSRWATLKPHGESRGFTAALVLYVLLHLQFRCPQYPSLNTEQVCWNTCELSTLLRGSSDVNSERDKGITWLSCWPPGSDGHSQTPEPESDHRSLSSLFSVVSCPQNRDFNLPDVNKVNLTKLWCAALD